MQSHRYKIRLSAILLVWALFAQAASQISAQVSPTLPIGDEQIHAVRLLNIPRAVSGGAQAAVTAGKSTYLAGKWWNEEDKENLWLWRLDDSGNKLWEKHLARQERTEEMTIVGLLPGANKFIQGPAAPGVRVVYRQGLETRLAFIKADGEVVLEKQIGILGSTHGLVVDNEDHLFLFGQSMTVQDQPSHAWVARVTRLGAVLWKHNFHADQTQQTDPEESLEEPAVPKGFYRTFLFDGALLEDGSVVIVGQSGVYNKFGQGPSRLWLLRIDRDGKKLAEAFIDGGRLLAGRDLIVRCGDGVIAFYTTDQLPPIAEVPTNLPPNFGIRLARFDGQLEKRWDKPLSATGMPGAAAITGPLPLVCLTALPDELSIHAVDEQGDKIWQAEVATPDGYVRPLATLRSGDDFIAVCNYRVSGSRDAEQQVLLVYATLPRQIVSP